MGDTKRKESGNRLKFTDILIVILCLSTAVAGIYLFRLDLYQTISSMDDKKPIGTIVIRRNIVQRRHTDRVLWDRLFVESPLYTGDVIRVAEDSSASLRLESNQIDLSENTLIRVQLAQNKKEPMQIELSQGSLDIKTEGAEITLSVMGRVIQAGPETALVATAKEDGLVVQVSKGTAVIEDKDNRNQSQETTRELTAGTMLALDTEGVEKADPAVVLILPRLDARYLKNGPNPINVAFSWNRINMESSIALNLEIASDRGFTQNKRIIGNLYDNASSAFGTGISYWRLCLGDSPLASGRVTVLEAGGPTLINPANSSLFRYQTDLPVLFFQWSIVAYASNYLVEVSDSPNFANPRIRRETSIASFTESSLTGGTWYWRVMPVFPPVYEGSAAFSSVASFRIERGILEEPVWVEPVKEEPVKEEPPPPPPPPPPPAPRPAPVTPPPPEPLAEAANRLPTNGHTIGIQELRTKRSIDFSWSPVSEANCYIITIFQETADGRRQILRNEIDNRTTWTLDNISILDRGRFIWQLEAVIKNSGGTITRRGKPGENSFILDIPLPSAPTIQIE